MINPKILEVFGEESKGMIMRLVGYLGEQVASKCYVVSNDCLSLRGVKMPQFFITTNSDKRFVENRIIDFVDDNTDEFEESQGMYLLWKRERMDGDMQLWLC